MGRVYRIRKRFCHVKVYLDIDERKVEQTAARVETKSDKAKMPTGKPAQKRAVVKKTTKEKTAQKATSKKSATKKTAAKKSKATSGSKTAKSKKKA